MSLPKICISCLLKYMHLKEIITKICVLSKEVRNHVLAENYILYKHFLEEFNLHDRMKRADLPARVSIMKMIKENILISQT